MAIQSEEERREPARPDVADGSAARTGATAFAHPDLHDRFSIARMDAALAGTQFHGQLHHYSSIGSTNAQALEDAQAGAAAGQVYIAGEQTAGRGRGGHSWLSEPEQGLYLTVLVRPPLHSTETLQLSLLAGLAAAEAVKQVTGVRVDLRWPNDLVIGAQPARKLGGILTEVASTPDGVLRHAAIGIGINLNGLAFPPELQGSATSLRLQTGSVVAREAVAVALLLALDAELERLAGGSPEVDATENIVVRFARASTWASGKQVRVEEDGGYTGVTAGLTAEGLLRVRCDSGVERTVRHGGVREL